MTKKDQIYKTIIKIYCKKKRFSLVKALKKTEKKIEINKKIWNYITKIFVFIFKRNKTQKDKNQISALF